MKVPAVAAVDAAEAVLVLATRVATLGERTMRLLENEGAGRWCVGAGGRGAGPGDKAGSMDGGVCAGACQVPVCRGVPGASVPGACRAALDR